MDRAAVSREMEQARLAFETLTVAATPADLGRRAHNTRWTNRQLLFHQVFGYLIVRTLMPLVHTLGRLGWSRRFSAALNAMRRPFHVINYLGSCAGAFFLTPNTMIRLMNRTIAALQRRLAAEPEQDLSLTMRFPPGWDPYFQSTMTVLDVYHYGTLHFDHHRHQLSY